jgi:MFS family permease
MTDTRPAVLKYYAYRVTTSMGLWVPVSVVYLLDEGFGLAFVATVQAVFSASLLLAEVPTGYLGDRLGRRGTLALGSGWRAACVGGYALADSAAAFVALQAGLGVAWALRSGTKDAWLYELLGEAADEDRFARVEGRGSSLLLAVSAAGAVAGGVLYGVDPRLPFAVNAGLAVLGVPVVLSTSPVGGDGAEDDGGALAVVDAVSVLRLQAGRPAVRWLVAYSVVVFLAFDLTRTFEQPALREVGVPVAGLGVLYAGVKVVSAGAAATVGWLQDRLGTELALALLAPVVAALYGALLVEPLSVVVVLFGYRSLRQVARPLRNQYLNDRLADVGRATVLSGVSMVLSLVGVGARLVAGPLAAETGAVAFLGLAGLGLATLAGVLWVATSPVRPVGSAGDAAPGPAAGD